MNIKETEKLSPKNEQSKRTMPQKNLHPVCHFRYRQKEQLHSHLIQAIQTKQKNPQLSPGSSQSQLQKMNFNNLHSRGQVN